ncbi:putative NADPH dehydrogenase [Teratosphaeria destructans]|uniref:NADPH dehydrogenase n=1 Tax=Teratosphaeria destructans TaxID=418781 RepID=A0A9W7STR8_9PEZI|nr:putative NADPH dehydrogenase [Teratosphaeria destructans]
MTSHHNVDDIQPQEEPHNVNRAAPGISYFTPAQIPRAGTALVVEGQTSVPKLFQPLKLRGMTLQNRIMLSPLCQYSAEDGHYTMWHKTHIGGIVQRGPGLTCIEATAVTPQGRITPEDVGLWKDSQVRPIAEVVEFAHSQGQKIMIQLAHAGRKASTVAPWLSGGEVAGPELNGWPDDVWGPSPISWNENHAPVKELSLQDIEDLKRAWADATKRALACGFDAIEIHNAHGYLLHSFISPVSNKRTDKYGGSFENRTRLTIEIVDLVRSIIPKDMPLFLRISATDWLEEQKDEFPESWTGDDTARLAPILAEHGVDLLDVSSGGNHPKQHPHVKPAYQAPFAIKTKRAVGDKLHVGSVGAIENAHLANDLLEKDGLDLVTVGRAFQKNPGLVFQWAEELDQQVQMPNQIRWGFAGRGKPSGTPIKVE